MTTHTMTFHPDIEHKTYTCTTVQTVQVLYSPHEHIVNMLAYGTVQHPCARKGLLVLMFCSDQELYLILWVNKLSVVDCFI